MKIDFVSDVSCPWCAIGLAALEQALARIDPPLDVELVFQPFELNPQMGREGQDLDEHLAQKYGLTPAQGEQNRATIRQRGAAVGVEFAMAARSRIYNTFDAHRLLHWAEQQADGRQAALKHALLQAYFRDGGNPSDHRLLVRLATEVGLDGERAAAILAGDEFAAEVRERQNHFLDLGIHAVPTVILDDRLMIQGGQPVEYFEQALRRIADGAA